MASAAAQTPASAVHAASTRSSMLHDLHASADVSAQMFANQATGDDLPIQQFAGSAACGSNHQGCHLRFNPQPLAMHQDSPTASAGQQQHRGLGAQLPLPADCNSGHAENAVGNALVASDIVAGQPSAQLQQGTNATTCSQSGHQSSDATRSQRQGAQKQLNLWDCDVAALWGRPSASAAGGAAAPAAVSVPTAAGQDSAEADKGPGGAGGSADAENHWARPAGLQHVSAFAAAAAAPPSSSAAEHSCWATGMAPTAAHQEEPTRETAGDNSSNGGAAAAIADEQPHTAVSGGTLHPLQAAGPARAALRQASAPACLDGPPCADDVGAPAAAAAAAVAALAAAGHGLSVTAAGVKRQLPLADQDSTGAWWGRESRAAAAVMRLMGGHTAPQRSLPELQPPADLKRLRTSSCRITGKLKAASPENDISTFIPTPTWGSPRVSDDQAAVAAAKLKGSSAVTSSGRPRRGSSLAARAATAAALFDEAAAAEGGTAAAAAAANVSGVGSGCADVPLTWQQQQQLENNKTFSGDGRGFAPPAAAAAAARLHSGSADGSADGTSAGSGELPAAGCDPWLAHNKEVQELKQQHAALEVLLAQAEQQVKGPLLLEQQMLTLKVQEQVTQQGVDTVSLAAISHGVSGASRPPEEQVERLAARMLAAEGGNFQASVGRLLQMVRQSMSQDETLCGDNGPQQQQHQLKQQLQRLSDSAASPGAGEAWHSCSSPASAINGVSVAAGPAAADICRGVPGGEFAAAAKEQLQPLFSSAAHLRHQQQQQMLHAAAGPGAWGWAATASCASPACNSPAVADTDAAAAAVAAMQAAGGCNTTNSAVAGCLSRHGSPMPSGGSYPLPSDPHPYEAQQPFTGGAAGGAGGSTARRSRSCSPANSSRAARSAGRQPSRMAPKQKSSQHVYPAVERFDPAEASAFCQPPAAAVSGAAVAGAAGAGCDGRSPGPGDSAGSSGGQKWKIRLNLNKTSMKSHSDGGCKAVYNAEMAATAAGALAAPAPTSELPPQLTTAAAAAAAAAAAFGASGTSTGLSVVPPELTDEDAAGWLFGSGLLPDTPGPAAVAAALAAVTQGHSQQQHCQQAPHQGQQQIADCPMPLQALPKLQQHSIVEDHRRACVSVAGAGMAPAMFVARDVAASSAAQQQLPRQIALDLSTADDADGSIPRASGGWQLGRGAAAVCGGHPAAAAAPAAHGPGADPGGFCASARPADESAAVADSLMTDSDDVAMLQVLLGWRDS